MLETLYDVCHRTKVAATEVKDAIGGILKMRRSQNQVFWSSSPGEMPKALEACNEATAATANLVKKLYPQLGQEQSTTLSYGPGGTLLHEADETVWQEGV